MTSTSRSVLAVAVSCAMLLGMRARVYAQAETPISSTKCGDGLKSFGPIGPFGYPSYYVDQNMEALDHCDEPLSVDPLCGNPDFGDPGGEGLPLGPIPDVASGNFWGEQFYTFDNATMEFPGGDALLTMRVEGVWDNATEAIIDGDQLVFSRIRVRLTVPNSPASVGIYTVTHPYGVETFNVTAADIAATAGIRAINFTDDCLHTVVGGVIVPSCAVADGDQFTNPLADLTDDTTSRISTWLKWDTGAPAGYIGDPAILHTITGGTCGTNFFQIDGPGVPGGSISTNLFSLMGRYAHFCGDGSIDANLGETCDDGNEVGGDCCSATCTSEPDGQACTDASACTTADTCSAGMCVGGAAPNCDDLVACTVDACVPATGCTNTPNHLACDDMNVCTTDVCTLTGCQITNNMAPCDDGNACTENDTCGGGICTGSPVVCPTAAPVGTILADVSVKSDTPNTNFGSATKLETDAGPAVKQTFFRVQVSGVGNRTVTLARLRLRVPNVSNANSVHGGRISSITNCGWGEATTTFNNKPAIDGALLDTKGAVALNQLVDFNVTAAITGDGTYCFAIDTPSTDGVDYTSKEGTAANRPVLEVTAVCPCAPPAPVCGDNIVNQPSEQCDGTSSAACPGLCSPTCTCPAPPAPATATVTEDAHVDSSVPNTNLGLGNQLGVDAGPTIKRTFLKIQVSNVTGTVTSALLNLRAATTSNAQSVSGGDIHKISDCSWTETGVTFNNQPAIDGGVLSTVGAVALGQAVSFNITAGLTGNGTHCFAIDSLSTDGVDYNSRQASTVANRPTVTLTVGP